MADATAPNPSSATAAGVPGGQEEAASASDGEDPIACLDSALLESIFYNEMLLLDDPSHALDMGTILGGSAAGAGNSVGESTHTTNDSTASATATVTSTTLPQHGAEVSSSLTSLAVAPPSSVPIAADSTAPHPPRPVSAAITSLPAPAAAPPAVLGPTTAAETAKQLAAHAAAMASALPPPLVFAQSPAAPPAVSETPLVESAQNSVAAYRAQPSAWTPPAAVPTMATPAAQAQSVSAATASTQAPTTTMDPSRVIIAAQPAAVAAVPISSTAAPAAPPPPKPTIATSVTISGGGLPALAVQAAAVAARSGARGPARPRGAPLPVPKGQVQPVGVLHPTLVGTQCGAPVTLGQSATSTPQYLSHSNTVGAVQVVTPLATPARLSLSQAVPPPAPAALSARKVTSIEGDSASPPIAEVQKAKQMVSQFAALASHLGISLPSNVLQSLTTAAQQKMQVTTTDGASLNAALGKGDLPAAKASAATETMAAGAAAVAGSQAAGPMVSIPQTAPSTLLPTSIVPGVPASAATALVAPLAPTAPGGSVMQMVIPSVVPLPQSLAASFPMAALPLPAGIPVIASALPPIQIPAGPMPPRTESFVRQLQETAEAAIAAVEDNRKRAASDDIDGYQHKSRPGVYKRKKKPRLEDCESRLAQLRKENETLKRHLSNVTSETQRFDIERQQAEAHMKEIVKKCNAAGRGGSKTEEGKKNGKKYGKKKGKPESSKEEEELKLTLTKFTEMYSDYGRRRQEELQFHLEQLEKLAVPTTFTKMTLWTMGQGDEFFQRPKSNPIAGILMKELGITQQQGGKIIEHRDRIKQVCANIRQCLVLLGRLNALCEHKQKVFVDRMTKCQKILTPLQVVKLLLFVDEQSDTLESVCPGWGSERIRKNPTGKEALASTPAMNAGVEKSASASAPASASSQGIGTQPSATAQLLVLDPTVATMLHAPATAQQKGDKESVPPKATKPHVKTAASPISIAVHGAPGVTPMDEGSTSSQLSAH